MEWAKQRTEQTNLRTVPSTRMKAGDFGELLTPSIWFGSPQIIKDPTTGVPFAGNIIPKSPAEPERDGAAGGVSGREPGDSAGHQQLVRRGRRAHQPAQGHHRHRPAAHLQRQHPVPRPALPLPGYRAFPDRLPVFGAHLRPAEPDRVAQLDAYLRSHRAAGNAALRQPRPGVHPHAGHAGIRPHQVRAQLPVHLRRQGSSQQTAGGFDSGTLRRTRAARTPPTPPARFTMPVPT